MPIPRSTKMMLKLFALGLLIAFVIWLSTLVEGSDTAQRLVQELGYIGVFIIAVLSGFNLIVPIPAITFLPVFVAAGLSPALVVVTISLGMTIGDGIGYTLGYLGRRGLQTHNLPEWFQRFEAWLLNHPRMVPLVLWFYASFAPAPNELVVIPAAVSGQRWYTVLLPVFLGNTVFNTLSALGITSIAELF